MKKITILMLLIMMSNVNVLYAQSKGDMYVGTLLGIGIQKHSNKVGDTKYEDNPIVSMEIDPGIHFFIADKFRIGLQMGLTTQFQKDEDDNKESVGTFYVGPVCAYYFQITDNFYFTPQLGVYYAHVNQKSKDGNVTVNSKSNGFCLEFLPVMLEFRPTTHFGFSASLLGIDYAHVKFKDNPDVKGNQFNFNFGLSPTIGLKYYF